MGAALVLLLSLVSSGCGGGAADDSSTQADAQRQPQAVAAAAEAAPSAERPLVPLSAKASAIERGDLGPEKAIDGNTATRWSSAFTDDQWLSLDFGARVSFSRVQIQWEAAHAKAYELQASDDGVSWSTLRAVPSSSGGSETLSALAGSGRHLRIKGLQRATPYGYSIFEIQAFGTAAGDPPPPPPPPPEPPTQPPTPPGVLKPVAALASGAERSTMSADKAIDGDPSTRWSSAFNDQQWIQFDLGMRQTIGAVKLQWQNAHAAAYLLQVSDDGVSWKTILTVDPSAGGIEEWYHLNAAGRYLRIHGLRRATAYGYSLWEVTILGPEAVVSRPPSPPYAEPAPGAQPVALYREPLPPIETIQQVEPDGTLVTFMGARSHERHARERGEDWTEADKGPGRYLSFPARYFRNRTFGIEIRDTIPAGGKTIEFWLHNPDHDHDGTTFSLFRNVLNPEVRDYGWSLNGGFTHGSPSSHFCPKGQRLCKLVVSSNWSTSPHSPLKIGDRIELAPAPFLARPTADGGGARYYSAESLYVVGRGLRPWIGVEPRLDSAPLPDETLSGGLGSVSYNYSDEAFRMFQQMFNNIGMRNAQRWVEGRRLLHTSFVTGRHSEHVNDNGVYEPAVGKAGPSFNKAACIECHTLNGRSPALALGQRPDAMSVLTGTVGADGKRRPDPVYGGNVQLNGSADALHRRISVTRFETETRVLPDGQRIELRKPVLDFSGGGALPQTFSLRAAMPLIGLGLLEAVPDEAILARADPDDLNGDGIRGIANIVFDGESTQPRLGRFGWKASKASIRQQVATALLRDMGVTTPVFPRKSCQYTELDCRRPDGSAPGVSEAELTRLTQYLALLAVPAQRSLRSGFPTGAVVLKEHDVNPAQIQRGRTLFGQANCIGCHTPELRTGANHPFAELRGQTIRPYTDLLLHDLGPKLADTLGEARATGRHWRTPPLWGIGLTPYVQGGDDKARYLHDGRARTLTEAILWHGGEADTSRRGFEAMTAADREALLAFLRSL
ncbi:di-heme oxidoredictase family protein [Pseudaquabacterium terrae]|uniref:di-heme oxidoredictase family protein n=1 Tax=Pseudaquabacterium terrae TaxID=2732868 RepID=UPI001FEB3AA1|nr:di-heme oxidoredictase family protein [Aquabacterium terrae]